MSNKEILPQFWVGSNSASWDKSASIIFEPGLHHLACEHIKKVVAKKFVNQFVFLGWNLAVEAFVSSKLMELHNRRILRQWNEPSIWVVDLRKDQAQRIEDHQVQHCECCNGVLIKGGLDLEGGHQYAGVAEYRSYIPRISSSAFSIDCPAAA